MSSHIRLADAMRKVLSANGIKEVPASGEFILPAAKPILFPGAVYGFAVCLSKQERIDLFEEAKARHSARIRDIADFQPIQDNLYPIYWGKDKQLGARPHQHLQNPTKTGAIRLSTYEALSGKVLACATLVVPDYVAAERIIQKAFPDLLKTTTVKYVA